MALSPNDLIEPTGRLQTALFPGEDMLALVTAWLATAASKAALAGSFIDAATEAYAYHLAYSHVADRLAAEPNSVSVDSAANISKSVGQDRIAYFSNLARKYLDEYDGYFSITPNPERPRSGMVRNRAVF